MRVFRRRAEDRSASALTAGQARLRNIVERLPDGILIIGEDGAVRFCNPAAEALFGRPAGHLVGTDFGFPTTVGGLDEVDIVRRGGASVAVELRMVETEWEGEPARLLSMRDVADKRRAAERAAQLDRERISRAEAEAASQAKSDFLATMSHELRTPLNAVIGYAQLLDLGIGGALTDDQHRQVSRIQDSARHLLGLVNEVLDLSKVESGTLSVRREAAHPSHVVDGAVSITQPMAEAAGIQLSATCDPNTPLYEGDTERVKQIVLNLLTNAVKFTQPAGKVVLRCCSATKLRDGARLPHGGSWVCFDVEDNGIGIPQDQIASIFDPFVQVNGGRTRPADGSGLGLTISRRLARLMKGDLTVRSRHQEGSTFTLWLPQASWAKRDAARWRQQSPATAAKVHGLSDVGAVLLREVSRISRTFVDRLRAECVAPGADTLPSSQLADHVAAFLADVSTVLIAIEEARGEPSPLVGDSTDLLMYIADRHGAQRDLLGWSQDAVSRDWTILYEETRHALRRAEGMMPEGALPEALLVIERLMEQAAERSLQSLTRAAASTSTA